MKIRYLFLILFLLAAKASAQQDSIFGGKLMHTIIDYGNKGIELTQKQIEKLEERDTAYITPNLYNFTLMAEYSYWYEYYRLSSLTNEQSISFAPEMIHKLGIYVGWRWLFVGWALDLEDPFGSNKGKTDLNFSFYTSKIGIDLFYRKTGNDFKIRDASGFTDGNGDEITGFDRSFSGMKVSQQGFNIYYIFNNTHFSYPAAYSQSTNQRISCGSFIAGISFSKQEISLDEKKLPEPLLSVMDSSLMFNKVSYTDHSINAGYTYNWVFAKNWLANISMTPAISYKHSKLEVNYKPELKTIFKNLNFDLIARLGLVYNNTKYYAGASFVAHTYTYRQDNFSLVNSFGVLRLYAGVNIWRKKEK